MRHLKYDKNCLYCNKQFIATRDDARFCSAACKAAHRRKHTVSIVPELPAEVRRALHPEPGHTCPECKCGGGAHAYGCSHQDDEIKKGTGGQVTDVTDELEKGEKLIRKLIKSLQAEVERRKAIKSTEINGNDSK
jgi:hypothetical protein